MQIRKIKKIKGYKSFTDFQWSEFCKNKDGQEAFLQKFSVVFGENGSGKSSLCDIFKNFSQVEGFENDTPSLVEIEINDGTNNQDYKYENSAWTPNQLDKKCILFFDVDFINANVHTHGVRSNNLQQGAHTQKAGKLIIDLDEQADRLKNLIEEKRKEIEIFEKIKSSVFGTICNEKDNNFFGVHKDISEEDKKNKILELRDGIKKLEEELISLQKLNTQYSQINLITNIEQVPALGNLSSMEDYIEICCREIKEKAQSTADEQIKSHFEKHRDFIESAKDQIPENYSKEDCPLCMQPLANATKVIDYYRTVFDKTYETAKKLFLSDIEAKKNELNAFKTVLNITAKVTSIFDSLEKIKTDFGIEGVYKLEEKTEYTQKLSNISIVEIDEIINILDSLKNIDRKEVDVSTPYGAVLKKIGDIKKSIGDLNILVATKNKLISDFKSRYSDQSKVSGEIQEKSQKKTEIQELLDFLQSDKILSIKEKNDALIEQKKFTDDLKKMQEDLKDYLEKTIPESVITQMITFLEKFNLAFNLEHIKPTTNTKDYSFAFKIKDNKGNERELKGGLSEGERQLISLAFFFAINENLQDKQNKILIFDDPITSLDSPNLKILAELIHGKVKDFSQTIVFTHHPLFFKYLAKCENPNPCKFGVLKNSEAFGGSFIFSDPGFDLVVEIKKCNEEIRNNAKNGELKPEEIVLKYGQLLRLAIERFIKNDLLMWDEKKFEEITDGLKQGKSKIAKLSDDDLEIMISMYKYCNYSNLLHADKETPSALTELIIHIDKFVKILDKIKE
jgi:wobble nucleotide-excising tRNase